MPHDSAVKLFQWRGRVSRKEFRKRFVAALRAAAPGLHLEDSQADDLDVIVRIDPNLGVATIALRRAYDEFEKAPGQCDEILARWVGAQLSLIHRRPMTRDNVVPMLKDREYLRQYHANYAEPVVAGRGRDLLHDDYNDELIVAYADFGSGINYLHVDDLAELGLSLEELRPVALANLRARTPHRDVVSAGGVLAISVRGNFEATMVLDEDLWRHPTLARLDPLIIAAPDRNSLLVAPDDSPASIWQLAYMARELANQESYPVSSRLMIRCGRRFELLDPVNIDASHPIPNLDAIDYERLADPPSAGLAIVIASPLDASPRSVYRLFRKVNGYLDHIASDDFRRRANSPPSERIQIFLHCNWAPPDELNELLDTIGGLVESRGARLRIVDGEPES